MEKLKCAQDLIKTSNSSVSAGFNMFVQGYPRPLHNEYHDHVARSQGYEYAENMAKKGELAFMNIFRCKCEGYPFYYGGFVVCNDCGGKNVNEKWWENKVEKDANEFCCHGLDFINLQESDNYAFGKTFNEAIVDYGKLMISK